MIIFNLRNLKRNKVLSIGVWIERIINEWQLFIWAGISKLSSIAKGYQCLGSGIPPLGKEVLKQIWESCFTRELRSECQLYQPQASV